MKLDEIYNKIEVEGCYRIHMPGRGTEVTEDYVVLVRELCVSKGYPDYVWIKGEGVIMRPNIGTGRVEKMLRTPARSIGEITELSREEYNEVMDKYVGLGKSIYDQIAPGKKYSVVLGMEDGKPNIMYLDVDSLECRKDLSGAASCTVHGKWHIANNGTIASYGEHYVFTKSSQVKSVTELWEDEYEENMETLYSNSAWENNEKWKSEIEGELECDKNGERVVCGTFDLNGHKYTVFVHKREGNLPPHVHVEGNNRRVCVFLEEPSYFMHGPWVDMFSEEEVKAFHSCMANATVPYGGTAYTHCEK